MCACLRDVAHHQRHFSCLISGFKRASFSFPFSFRRPDVSSSKTPKCCCFHRPVNRLPLRSLFSVSALRFSCEKTQSGFLVIEHVCVELNLCECDVVPRRRRRRRGMENVNSTVVWQEQTWWPTADSPMFLLWSRYLASLSVFTHPPPPLPSILTPPPLLLTNCTNMIRAPGKHGCHLFFPSTYLKSFIFSLGCWESQKPCLHLEENTRCTRSLNHISRLFPASIPSILKI